MKQGDIFIVQFPFTDFSSAKIRPALIVSNNNINNGQNVVIVRISTKNKEHYSMPINQQDLSEGQLYTQSYVRFSNICSCDKRILIKKVASLHKKSLIKVIDTLIENFRA